MSASLEEIEELYRGDLDRFLRVAAAILGDREAARDAVHEGFAVAVRKRGSYSGRGLVAAWVWQVVVNTVRNYKRGRDQTALELRDDLSAARGNGDVDSGRLQAALLLCRSDSGSSFSSATTQTSTTAPSRRRSESKRAPSARP
jgi:DNA-directed RNA polymerase specialized sigma24 family protein